MLKKQFASTGMKNILMLRSKTKKILLRKISRKSSNRFDGIGHLSVLQSQKRTAGICLQFECHTMLTLSDLEMLLAHQGADKHTLQYALEEMEAAGEQYDLDAEELKMLGIGHINLKHLRLGFAYLQDSLKLNPNDVVLSSQVNALAIRLAEIEEQENIHSSMPKNRKILVVDDSATVRKLISGKLSKKADTKFCAPLTASKRWKKSTKLCPI